jgi:hypothetical protein
MSWEAMKKRAAKQVADTLVVSQRVLQNYGATLCEFECGIPPSVLSTYIAHESGGQRWTRTEYPEFGLAQLTGRKGDNEVTRYKVHPYHPRSHIWAAQQAFWAMYSLVNRRLRESGYMELAYQAVADQVSLLILPRAIGIGCLRGLLKKSVPLKMTPIPGIRAWLGQPSADTSAFDGQQGTDLVRLRYLWCTGMVARTQEVGLGPLPNGLVAPDTSRPTDLVPLPSDFFTRNDYYTARAKQEGPTPTGPWPGGLQ